MRIAFAILFTLLIGSMIDTARADPYRWCADYVVGGDGGTQCTFLTYEQCMLSASGRGGICRQNYFYDGRPFDTPGPASRARKPPQKSN